MLIGKQQANWLIYTMLHTMYFPWQFWACINYIPAYHMHSIYAYKSVAFLSNDRALTCLVPMAIFVA